MTPAKCQAILGGPGPLRCDAAVPDRTEVGKSLTEQRARVARVVASPLRAGSASAKVDGRGPTSRPLLSGRCVLNAGPRASTSSCPTKGVVRTVEYMCVCA